MSDEMRHSRRTKAVNREKVVSVTLVIAIIAVLSLLLHGRIKREEQMLLSVQDKLKKIGPVAEELERMEMAVNIKDLQSDKNKIALDTLSEIYRITPQSVSISVYKFDGKDIEIKGSAEVLSEVFRYVKSSKIQKFSATQSRICDKKESWRPGMRGYRNFLLYRQQYGKRGTMNILNMTKREKMLFYITVSVVAIWAGQKYVVQPILDSKAVFGNKYASSIAKLEKYQKLVDGEISSRTVRKIASMLGFPDR
jgi:hypothetical protein